jgi:Holliday junction resolvase RusA-like endonuclease
MPRTLRFTIPPTGNHRLIPIKVNGKLRLATAKKMRDWKDAVAKELEGEEPIENLGGYIVKIKVWWPDRRRRDLDGPVKVIFDALVKAKIITDDSDIRFFSVEDMSSERYGDDIEPGIDVTITTMAEFNRPF